MSDPDETVADVLGTCDNEHCQALSSSLELRAADGSALGYEDVFYPARHHAHDGVVLHVDLPDSHVYIEWGSGDLFYRLEDDKRTFQSAVDPGPLWEGFSRGEIGITPVLREDTPFGEADDV